MRHVDYSQFFPGMEFYSSERLSIENDANRVINKKYRKYLDPTRAWQKASNQFSDIQNELLRNLRDTFLPFHHFMEHALFNESFGYYGSGSVRFQKSDNLGDGHFSTFPYSASPAFGAMIAYQAYAMWLSMLESNDIASGETFHIVELGAGEGQLADDILHSVLFYRKQEIALGLSTQWCKFFDVVKYIACERHCDRFKQNQLFEDKLTVLSTDIRVPNLKSKLGNKKVKGVVISNELLDAFAVHKIRYTKDNNLGVCVLLPALSKKWLTHISHRHRKELECKSKLYSAQFSSFFEKITLKNDEIFLSGSDWCELKVLDKTLSLDQELRYLEFYIDANLFPEIDGYLRRHSPFLANQFKTTERCYWYLNSDIEAYVKSVTEILHSGFVLTLDYGDDTLVHAPHATSNQPLRTYPYSSDFYTSPGSVDMTTDINFTELFILGKEAGLDLVFYETQSHLADNFLRVAPQKALAPFDLENVFFTPTISNIAKKEFREFDTYKMMLQRKTKSANDFGILQRSRDVFPRSK